MSTMNTHAYMNTMNSHAYMNTMNTHAYMNTMSVNNTWLNTGITVAYRQISLRKYTGTQPIEFVVVTNFTNN